MAEPLRIDIFSDVICPWCLIGRERLRQALERLDPEQPVAIRWLPFELNPEMPREGMDRRDYAEAKFGGIDQAREIYANIAEAGRAEGIEFDFSRLQRTPSTFNAHRLLWLASSKGLGDLLKDGLFRAYFMEARDIGDLAVLTELATAAGMDSFAVTWSGASARKRCARWSPWPTRWASPACRSSSSTGASAFPAPSRPKCCCRPSAAPGIRCPTRRRPKAPSRTADRRTILPLVAAATATGR